MRSGRRPVMAAPSKVMRPPVGRRNPVMQLNAVVFPAPLGPMMLRISRGRTVNDTSATATSPPKRMVRASTPRTAPVWTCGAAAVMAARSASALLGRGSAGRDLCRGPRFGERDRPFDDLPDPTGPQSLGAQEHQDDEADPERQHPDAVERPERFGQDDDDG